MTAVDLEPAALADVYRAAGDPDRAEFVAAQCRVATSHALIEAYRVGASPTAADLRALLTELRQSHARAVRLLAAHEARWLPAGWPSWAALLATPAEIDARAYGRVGWQPRPVVPVGRPLPLWDRGVLVGARLAVAARDDWWVGWPAAATHRAVSDESVTARIARAACRVTVRRGFVAEVALPYGLFMSLVYDSLLTHHPLERVDLVGCPGARIETLRVYPEGDRWHARLVGCGTGDDWHAEAAYPIRAALVAGVRDFVYLTLNRR